MKAIEAYTHNRIWLRFGSADMWGNHMEITPNYSNDKLYKMDSICTIRRTPQTKEGIQGLLAQYEKAAIRL